MNLHPIAHSALRALRAPHEERHRHRGRAALPGWLIFLLLGLAGITATRVLPGSEALLAFSGTPIAP